MEKIDKINQTLGFIVQILENDSIKDNLGLIIICTFIFLGLISSLKIILGFMRGKDVPYKAYKDICDKIS